MQAQAWRSGGGHETARVHALLHQISCIVPPAGMFFAASLFTTTSSTLCFVPLTHWPSTSGVLLTFFIGPAPPHLTGPTTVASDVAATASRTSAALVDLARLSASAATSNSACAKPIGWVHCFLVPAS